MTRDIKQRTRWGVGLAVGLTLLLALCGASRVRAADDGGADPPKKVKKSTRNRPWLRWLWQPPAPQTGSMR